MDCRVPGASTLDEFWNNMKEGRDTVSSFTKEELIASGESLKDINSPNYIPRRGIVGGVEQFDAAFFGFTPREAELLDPQHRLFLECCWHSLEDAGYAVRDSKIRVGVFGGAGTAWYLNDVYNTPSVKKYADSTSIVTASDRDYLTTRVSYKLNLDGPSLDIQSACSTAMASIVLGVNTLLSYQSDLVLAGGVSVQYPEKVGYLYQQGGLESADGICRPFDKKANGTLFSRGCGVVLLKRLDEAIRDKDHIYAVIRSGAINNDGNKKVGFTAPSIEGQKEVIWEALELAEISAEDITMVEAHGTATPVGDPIEVTSLSESFFQYTDKKQYCALGSVKSNIGHTDAASGVIAVIKTALALKNRQIPASIHYSEPNPKIDFENSPFFVNTELRDWSAPGVDKKRTALVNSFGVGGTNACVVMEESPAEEPRKSEIKQKYAWLGISAMQKEVLEPYTASLKTFLQTHPEADVYDMAYTSLTGRKHFKHKAFVAFKDREDLLVRLDSPFWPKKGEEKETRRPVVFMFPGQGNQYVDMGRQLYNAYPVFKATVDECAELIKEDLGRDIREVIYPKSTSTDNLIDQTLFTQPAIFIISYAQACLLRSWGVHPDYLIGHSVGEYVAAALSGIFTLKDALKAVTYRAKLVQELPKGAMLAVLLTEDELKPTLGAKTSIGVVSYPGLTVASGPFDEINVLETKLTEKKIFHKRIPTSHAFHSGMMDPMLDKYRDFFKDIRFGAPQIPIISTVTGKQMRDEDATSFEYWVKHVRNTVRFSDAVFTMLNLSASLFIEVGPGQSLEAAVKRHLEKGSDNGVVGTMRTPNMEMDDMEYLVTALGSLWTEGMTPDWGAYFEGEDYRHTSFPLYPYNRKTYIVKRSKIKEEIEEEDAKKTDLSQWTYLPSWKRSVSEKFLLEQYIAKTGKEGQTPEITGWMVMDDGAGIGKAIETLLTAQDEVCYIVKKGQAFQKEDTTHYVVNPSEKEDYDRLIAALKVDGKIPNRIIHLWNVDKAQEIPAYSNCLAREELAFYSPLYLEQAFIKENLINNLNLLVVSNGLFSIGSESVLNPLKALSMGPVRSIHCEMKGIFGKFADINVYPVNAELTATQLIDEVQFRNEDLVVAFRKHTRWVECFDKIPYGNIEKPRPIFKNNGVYLITGGTGGLGLEFARHIANQTKASIILTYRTPLPDKEEWDRFIRDYPSDITTEKIKIIRQIESQGSKVYLFKAETNDREQMQALKVFADRQLGGINGVIHSAGAAGGGIIALKTKQMADDVLKVKTRGTLLIDELLGIDKLDFVVYFSSVTSVLGESGRVDYCAANSFLDHYTYYRNQLKPGSTFCINWDSWSKIGMAARWNETQALTRKKMYLNEKSSIPGLHLVSKNESEEVYQVGFNDDIDWVYKEHRVNREWTIVGTFIIDLLTQYAHIKYEEGTPVISDLYFLKPLFVMRGEIPNIRLYAKPENGRTKVDVSILEITKDADKWNVVATAYVGSDKGIAKETVDHADAIRNFGGESIDKQMFERVENNGIETLCYGPRWLNITKEYKKENSFIVEQQLDATKYASDYRHFTVHPALLDVTVANLFTEYTSDPFLPFNYKSIRVTGSFTPHIYAYVDVVSKPETGKNMAVFDVRIYNECGELILVADKYSLVNIAGKGAETKETKMENDDKILPEEGVEIFDRILYYGNDANIIVSPFNLLKTIRDMKELDDREEQETETAAIYERPDLSTDYVEPTNEVEKMIAKIWGQILGVGQIGIYDKFNELGGNSLLVVQAVSNISEAFGIQLPVDVFKDGITVESLSETIMEMLVQDIDDTELDALLKEIGE